MIANFLRKLLVAGAAVAALSACASIAKYDTPTIQADTDAALQDFAQTNADVTKLAADRAANPAAVPTDIAAVVADGVKDAADAAKLKNDIAAAKTA